MSYETKSLSNLLSKINKTIFLPHIQRAFVWKQEQISRLFDSLMRNYPIQTLLFWKTRDFIKARNFMDQLDWDVELSKLYNKNASEEGVEKTFVLDGQQRLQTLYSLFKGEIMIEGKLHKAYFKIDSGTENDENDLLYSIKFSDIELFLPYIKLSDFHKKFFNKDSVTLSEEINNRLDKILVEDSSAKNARKSLVFKNSNKIKELLFQERFFWFEELDSLNDPQLTYDKILDIFIRVNNGGTKLDGGDLMFAAMKSESTDFEENVEDIVDLLNSGTELMFDKFFVLKCLSIVFNKGAQLNPKKFNSKEGKELLKNIEINWNKVEDAFKEFRDFLVHDLMIYRDKVIRSYISLIVVFDFIYNNPKSNPKNIELLKSYYYRSQLFNWFSAQTDALLDSLHSMVGKKLIVFPIADIVNYFKTSRKKIVNLEESHLLEVRLRYIILNLIYVEKFSVSPFDVVNTYNEPNIDHIYPQSQLRKLSLETSEINHIGNFRFICQKENSRKRAQLPDSYFSDLKIGGVNIERHLLLKDFANDPCLLKYDVNTYREFRNRRLNEIFKIASKIVNK